MLNRLSLNKLSLNRIDLNRIGGRDVGVSARPYIDPELLSHVKMAISTWGKSNDDPDRTVFEGLVRQRERHAPAELRICGGQWIWAIWY